MDNTIKGREKNMVTSPPEMGFVIQYVLSNHHFTGLKSQGGLCTGPICDCLGKPTG